MISRAEGRADRGDTRHPRDGDDRTALTSGGYARPPSGSIPGPISRPLGTFGRLRAWRRPRTIALVGAVVLGVLTWAVPSARAQTPCIEGYVWREARPGDRVCVIPQSRALAARENALTAYRRVAVPRGGVYDCRPGWVWREAFATDRVCVTPAARDRVRAENAMSARRTAGGAAPFTSVGRHTILVGMVARRGSAASRSFNREACGIDQGGRPLASAGYVGFGQVEYGGFTGRDACASFVLEQAYGFDRTVLDRLPYKRIERAVLRWDEEEAGGGVSNPCARLVTSGGIPVRAFRCWQNGAGRHERKSDSCAVVASPRSDWMRDGGGQGGPLAVTTWGMRRLGVRHWDVTQALALQFGQSFFHGPGDFPERGYGIALVSPLFLRSLTAQDDTVCVSEVTNMTVEITFTVYERGRPPGPR